MNLLYEPMLSRDLEGIRRAVGVFRERHSSEDLFRAVSRFAVLAASPSQHGKHVMIACMAAREIEATAGERYDELLTECAIYAAQSRLPWSEPPVGDPPVVEPGHPDTLDEIRAAIRDRDRLRGERWLAARLKRGSIARDFFTVAAEDLSDFGHKLIVAVGVWKLALAHQQPESYPFLRVAVGEWTAYSGNEPPVASGGSVDEIVRQMVTEKGSIESFHKLVLYDSDQEARRIVSGIQTPGRSAPAPSFEDLPIYTLGRDYAEYLKAFAIAARFPEHAAPILDAAKYNRDHASSFEEWSFA